MHYDALIKRMKREYTFLKGVTIDAVHGWGSTAYTPEQNSIVLYFDSLLEFSKTKRFLNRLGKANDFEHAFILVLLHEIHHVWQEKNLDPMMLLREKLAIDDSESHDESWMEKDADMFAKKEVHKWI